MKKAFCDLCGQLAEEWVFEIPMATEDVIIKTSTIFMKTTRVNLCEECIIEFMGLANEIKNSSRNILL